MRFTMILAAILAAGSFGCHHDNPPAPVSSPTSQPDFSAMYEVQSIRPGDYSKYVITLNRPNPDVDPASGKHFVGSVMELKAYMQDDLKAVLEPGTSVVISIKRQSKPVGGFICRCGSLCSARRGGICQSGCGCPIGH